jgi:hypothetical protein
MTRDMPIASGHSSTDCDEASQQTAVKIGLKARITQSRREVNDKSLDKDPGHFQPDDYMNFTRLEITPKLTIGMDSLCRIDVANPSTRTDSH